MTPTVHTLPSFAASDVPAVTRAQMREVDRVMIHELGISLVQMMENAGLQLADLVRRLLASTLTGRRVAVLAGRGNNGGGGLAAARRLDAWGARVSVVIADAPERFQDVPAMQLDILRRMNVPVSQFDGTLPAHDVLVDALIGYGLEEAPRGATRDLIAAANESAAPTISLDAPSGVDVDTGEAPGEAIRAQATLTLALPKIGLLESGARPLVGELYVADIGVPPSVYAGLGLDPPPLFADGQLVRLIR
ncbi:MAG: NAD(P)H-hydrate epimerase [Dehalococcoidia bacterium]